MPIFIRLFAFLAVFALFAPAATRAQERGPYPIRDAEIERIIRNYSTPLFIAAGLDPLAVETTVIADKSLNAFVAGGQRVFVFTGLINAAKTPNQIIGVMAHETGHISGGHLARTQDALKSASTTAIISMLLGAAAIAAGAPDAGAAIISSSGDFAARTFLKYSRAQESSADQAALKFLDKTGQSGRGLIEFFEILGDQSILLPKNQDPYVQSHPLTDERIQRLRTLAEQSPHYDTVDSPENIEALKRMQAKLRGFLDPVDKVFRTYPLTDASLYARYARAVAYHRKANFPKALGEIESLTAEFPEDPFFHELHGQILLESGKVAEAAPPLRESVRLAPDEPLLRALLGQAILADENASTNAEAIEHLEIATRRDRSNSFAWYQLALGYSRAGMFGMADLATAENYLLENRVPEAAHVARRAAKALPAGSPSQLRALDITSAIQGAMTERERKREEKRREREGDTSQFPPSDEEGEYGRPVTRL